MYGIRSDDPAESLSASLTYWVFRCRDKGRTPAMGARTWEYLQSSIQNAAIASRTLEDYIEGLARKLVVPHLSPKEWTRTIRADSPWIGWREILQEAGIAERHVLLICRARPHIVATYVRVRFEEDRNQIEVEGNDEV